MNRFLWLIRREVWEHKAIWVAPAIVIGCLVLLVLTGNVHLGPGGHMGDSHVFNDVPHEQQVKLLAVVYAGLALVVFMVMGIVAFFYSIDSLYADRRDRSVLFWKSLPLSDFETVLSKFATAIVVIPLVALAASAVAQLVVAAGGSARLSMSGLPGGLMWEPQALLGGFMVAFLWCVTAMLWYSPIVGYLMLASAWAPRGPGREARCQRVMRGAISRSTPAMSLSRSMPHTAIVSGANPEAARFSARVRAASTLCATSRITCGRPGTT